MPKMKTKRTLAKRVKVTGSGKLKRHHAYTSHFAANKSHKQKVNLRKSAVMDKTDEKRVKVLLQGQEVKMRVKGSTPTRNRRKKVLKAAKGYFGSKHLLYRTANEQVMRSLRYSFNDRRKLKNNMRKLWIARINAGARLNGLSYSKLMHGLKLADVQINRKMLSEIAIHDPEGFTSICETASKALNNQFQGNTLKWLVGETV